MAGDGIDRVAQVMGTVAPFDALTGDERAGLARECRVLQLEPHELLLGDGDLIDHSYILTKGHLVRHLLAPDGTRMTVNSTRPVTSLALTAAFEASNHIGLIEANTASEVVSVPAKAVRALFSVSTRFALAVAHAMAQSSIRQTQIVQELMFPVTTRVARFLLGAMDADRHIELASKSEVAGRMGTRPETFSRALASLCRDGLIQMDGRSLTVPDPEALRAFACL